MIPAGVKQIGHSAMSELLLLEVALLPLPSLPSLLHPLLLLFVGLGSSKAVAIDIHIRAFYHPRHSTPLACERAAPFLFFFAPHQENNTGMAAALPSRWGHLTDKLRAIEDALAQSPDEDERLDAALQSSLRRLEHDNAAYIDTFLPKRRPTPTEKVPNPEWAGDEQFVTDASIEIAAWTDASGAVLPQRAHPRHQRARPRSTLFLLHDDEVRGPFDYRFAKQSSPSSARRTSTSPTFPPTASSASCCRSGSGSSRTSTRASDGSPAAPRSGWAASADEMGLGKTIQLIGLVAFAHHALGRRTTLLVVPKSTLASMERDLRAWYPAARLRVFGADDEQPDEKIEPKEIAWAEGNVEEIHLCSHPFFQKHAGDVADWKAASNLVVDEGHEIFKRRPAKSGGGLTRFQRAIGVGADARGASDDRLCVIATATPLGNVRADMLTLLECCCPRLFDEAPRLIDDAMRGAARHDDDDEEARRRIRGIDLAHFMEQLRSNTSLLDAMKAMRRTFILQRGMQQEMRDGALSNFARPLRRARTSASSTTSTSSNENASTSG